MKLGVICDGISRDLAHALRVMDEFGLTHAELQYVGAHEVGDHTASEIAQIKTLLAAHEKPVSCLSRHIFAGMTVQAQAGDADHSRHMEALKRVIDMAHQLDCALVRIMTPKKEQILWGHYGAEIWNVAKGAWEAMLPLLAPAVELARAEGVQLVVETGNGTMINSNAIAVKLIDALEAKDALKVLWDPANNCWCHEQAYPDGFEAVQNGYLGHVHIKDVRVDTPNATLTICPMGEGQLGPLFTPLAAALKQSDYAGVVSFESVYHPGNGDFETGFRQNINAFKSYFS